MTDTVISGKDGFTSAVVPREGLYRVQTPQSFRLSVIREAFDSYNPETDGPVTDDATLVLRRGGRVAIVKGSAANVKITTPEDLR
jgi:2-C-methyl-D-erythritol 4-phosphate cytidylyltransferase